MITGDDILRLQTEKVRDEANKLAYEFTTQNVVDLIKVVKLYGAELTDNAILDIAQDAMQTWEDEHGS